MTQPQPTPILQSALIDPPWSFRNGDRLPGTGPVGAQDWIRVDDAYAGQMALRERLIDEHRGAVHALQDDALPAAQELLSEALRGLAASEGFEVTADQVTRPDGGRVALERAAPLLTLGRLVQEDFVILQKQGAEHVMTGAILCFPASWMLSEKFARPLVGIHAPVEEYDENIARRVQRLFDAIQPGRPIMRANCLPYADFALFQPRSIHDRRARPNKARARYVRTERQCLLRLPQTGAVAFTIHTCVVERDAMGPQDRADLEAHLARNGHLLGEASAARS